MKENNQDPIDIESLLKNKSVVRYCKMHIFELITPAQFEILKRMGAGYL